MKKSFLMAVVGVFLIYNIALSAMPKELALYFSFDKSTINGDTVKDQSLYGNDGKFHGDPKTVEGYIGEALDFSNDSVKIPTSDSLAETSKAITIETWIFARTHKVQDIVSKWDNDMNGIIHFEARDNGAMRFCMRDKNDGIVVDQTTTSTFPTNIWTHITITYDGKDAKIYFNAEEVGIQACSGEMRQNDNCVFYIGSMYTTDRWIEGLIDEMRIWSIALSPDEVKKAMEGSLVKASVKVEGNLSSTWGRVKGLDY